MKKNIKITYKFIILIIFIISIISTKNVVFASWADLDDTTSDKITNQEQKNQETKVQESVTKSNNNYLSSLKIKGYDLSPEFNKQTMNYQINDVATNEIEISATTDNTKAKIDGIGKIKITSGENNIKIKVTAENGDERVYTITIKNKNEENNVITNNEITNTEVQTSTNLENTNNQVANNTNTNNKLIFAIVGIVLILIFILIIIKNKKSRH